MTPRLWAALLLTAVVLLPALAVWWALSTISHLPTSGDPARWWSCTSSTVDTTPPPCLTEER